MNRNTMFFIALLGILLFGSLGLSGADRIIPLMANDPDHDGVPDPLDLCPQVNASFFDRNGDGCVDDASGARHTEFWVSADLPFVYRINANGAPGIANGSDFTAIQSAMNAWAAIAGTGFTVSYGGTTPQQSASALDGMNLITFEDYQYQFSNAVIAVGISTSFTVDSLYNNKHYLPGQIFDADIIFNPVKAFRTPTAGNAGIDIQSVSTHEAGHLFGIAHSPVRTSTMFYVLAPGTGAASLSTEDKLEFLKAYANAATLAGANRISGTVTSGSGAGGPVPGAIVWAINAAGDTVAADYTMPDGSYTFLGMADGSYYIGIYPLDGTSAIGGLEPDYINALVETTAVTVFPPEYYDQAESNADDPTDKTVVAVAGGTKATGIDIITNVDLVPPEIVSITPVTDGTDVRIDAALKLTFSKPMDDATIQGNFKLKDAATQAFIIGKATFLKDDSVIVFTPTVPYNFNTPYDLTLKTGLKDIYGNGLAAEYTSSFTTEAMPPLAITSLSPSKGVVGNLIVVNGVGFSSTANENSVSFGSVNATVVDAYPNRLLVNVPAAAATDLVTVSIGENVSNGLTFTVLSAIEVARGFQTGVAELNAAPRSIAVLPNGGWAYVATSAGVSIVVIDPGLQSYLTVTSLAVPGGLDAMEATPDGKTVYGVSRSNRRLYTIDTDPSHGPTFNTIISEHQLSSDPLGVCIDPGGGRAYISTLAGEIQIWDVRTGSATFESQIGALVSPDGTVRGKMAIDPAGEYLLTLSGAGKMNVFDLGPDTLFVQVPVLFDPQDVVIDPTGQRSYVSDGSGNVTVVSLQPIFKVQDINTGGSTRGMTLTPGGVYLYACNQQLNDIDVIDLNENSSTFRSVAATIDLAASPIDIALSPDGFYAFSVTTDTRQLVVTTIGLGPTLASISRRAGPVGARLVLAGSGFGTEVSMIRIQFGGPQSPSLLVQPTYSTGTSLEVGVPSWAGSGPMRVITSDSYFPAGNYEFSNSLYFQVLPGSSGPGSLRLASGVPAPGSIEFTDALALSPTGDFLIAGGSLGEATILDTDPASATFDQFINSIGVSAEAIDDIAITPDGERAFFGVGSQSYVRSYDVNRHSKYFGKALGQINVSTAEGPTSIGKIAIAPDGERLLVPVGHTTAPDSVYVVDIVPGSTGENKAIGYFPGLMPRDIAFHPGGRFAYLLGPSDSILVVNISPLQEPYYSVFGVVVMPDTLSTPRIPYALAFTPDGKECLVVTLRSAGQAIWNIIILDTSDPASPRVVGILDTDCRELRPFPRIDVSPQGDRAIVALTRCAYYTINLAQTPHVMTSAYFDMSLVGGTDMDFTPDGSRFYVAAPYAASDSIYVYDFSFANSLQYVSGNEQSGVIGQPLSAPLRVFVGIPDSATVGVPGVPLTFKVTGGGGYFTDSHQAIQTVATDQNGYAEIDWTLGPVVGVQTQFVSVEALGLTGSPLQFVADSYDDPATLPLQFTQILPLNGATGVSATSLVQGQFTRAVNPASIVDSTFYILDPGPMSKVPVSVGFSDNNRKVTLIPKTAFDYGTEFFVRWTAGIHDADGGALMNPGKSTFTTGTKPPLMLSSVTPPSSSVGASLVLAGQGFDPAAADNKVLFNDVAVSPFDAGVDYFKVKVPVDAISGQVRVVSAGDTSNTMPFVVLVPSTSPVDEVVATVGTGSSTNSVAVTPDGALAYSVSPEGDVVVPIDVEGQASYPGIQVGDNPVAVAINADGTYAYVCNFGSGTVSVIVVDPDSTTFNKVVETITVGTNPIDVEVNPDGGRVYVANAGSSNVSVIDGDNASATKNQVVATVATGSSAKSVVVTPDGTRIYVGTDNGYVVLDAETNGVVGTVATGSSTKSVAITPDGALLVVLTTNGTVVIYDIQPGSSSENEVVATVQTGSSVKSVVVTPDGAMLYIILENSDNAIAYSLTVVGSVGAFDPNVLVPPPVVQVAPVDTIPTGKNPACIAFDPSGSGLAIICNAGDKTVTILNASGLPAGPIPAEVDICPSTLLFQTPRWLLRWVMGRIELPAGYWPEEIDIGSVRLQNAIKPVPWLHWYEDRDRDGKRELVLFFDRVAFQALLPQGEYVPVTISGMARNRPFFGVDTIRTIRPTVIHPSGEVLTMDAATNIVWTSPKGFKVDSVSIDWTLNDGRDWRQIARRIPDTHSYLWRVPMVMSDSCRVMITLWSCRDILGQGMSQDMFMIGMPLAVTLESFSGAFEKEAAVLRWSTLVEQNLDGFNILRSESEADGYACITAKPIPAGGSSSGGSYEFTDPDVGLNRIYYYKLEGMSAGGSKDLSGPYKVVCRAPFALEQNAPNPFNPTTSIKFTIAEDSHVTLAVYDVSGRRVKTLVNGDLKANFYRVEWDGRNDEGRKVTSGMYFYRLNAGSFVRSHKMILLR